MRILKKFIVVFTVFCCCFIAACGGGGKKEEDGPKLSHETLTMIQGAQEKLEANFEVEEWSVTPKSIVTVTTAGIVTALRAGEAIVTATGAKESASCVITVTEDTITISQRELVLVVGDTYELTASALSGKTVSWSSNANSIATVSENGLVTAIAEGETKIIVKRGLSSTYCNVTVVSDSIRFSVTADRDSLIVGEEATIILNLSVLNKETGNYDEVTEGFTYLSSAEGVLSVENGVVTAVAAGKGSVTVVNEAYSISREISFTVLGRVDDFDLLNSAHVATYGRVSTTTYQNRTAWELVNTASGLSFNFYGTEIKATMASVCNLSPSRGYVKAYVDGVENKIALDGGSSYKEYVLASGLTDGLHVVEIYKVIEEYHDTVYVAGVDGENIQFYQPNEKPEKKIVFFGDSITAGYGAAGVAGESHNSDTEDGTRTYAFLTARELGMEMEALCMQGISLVVPGWRSNIFLKDCYNKTSVQSSKVWTETDPADYIVINIGTNDAYGISSNQGTKEQFVSAYKTFIANLRTIHPNAHIICCYGMMTADLNVSIQGMVDELNDDKVHGLAMILASGAEVGAAGHPGASNHERNADLLISLIKKLES